MHQRYISNRDQHPWIAAEKNRPSQIAAQEAVARKDGGPQGSPSDPTLLYPDKMRKSTLLLVCLTAVLLIVAYPMPGAWRTVVLIGAAAVGTAALIMAIKGYQRRHD